MESITEEMEDLTMICGRCGHAFDPNEAVIVGDVVDVIDGVPYREYRDACPECGSVDIAEYARCLSCHDHYEPDELYGGVICGRCLDQYAKTPRLLEMYVEEDPHRYAKFIASLIKGDEIDE